MSGKVNCYTNTAVERLQTKYRSGSNYLVELPHSKKYVSVFNSYKFENSRHRYRSFDNSALETTH